MRIISREIILVSEMCYHSFYDKGVDSLRFIRERRIKILGRIYTISKKWMILLCTAALLSCVIFGVVIEGKNNGNKIIKISDSASTTSGSSNEEETGVSPDRILSTTPAPEPIYIHVAGAVVNPGLIELLPGERIADAIDAAGGFTELADISEINLALRVSDGMKIYVPVQGENAQLITPEPYSAPAASATDSGSNSLININTASLEELKSLEGIGDATAQKIISYRNEHGRFSSTEDIMSVSGIGQSKFNAIKDRICV